MSRMYTYMVSHSYLKALSSLIEPFYLGCVLVAVLTSSDMPLEVFMAAEVTFAMWAGSGFSFASWSSLRDLLS